MLSGLYSKSVNIDVFLKGHSGDPIRVDRVGRSSEVINNPTLTVLLAVQSTVIKGLMNNKVFRGRGLTARFLYSYPTSIVGSRKYRVEPIEESHYIDYQRVINNILSEEIDTPEIIVLSTGADILLEEFANWLEPKLTTDYQDIADWCGKLIGATLRIAGILTRASISRCTDFLSDNKELVVSKDIMGNAIMISKYFLEHARLTFSVMGADSIAKDSKYLLDAIKKSELKEFSIRDCMRLCRIFKTKEEIEKVLNHLIDLGYFALKDERNYLRTGRPPGVRYLVNPKI